MKIKELKNGETLQIIDGYYDDLNTIKTKIITDGKVESQTDKNTETVDNYKLCGKEYCNVNKIVSKDINIKDYSFIVEYLIAKEFRRYPKVMGWYDIVKNVSVYVNDKKDKDALKEARKVIKELSDKNNSIDFSTIYSIITRKGYNPNNNKIEFERQTENVYGLKRKIRR